MQVVCEDIGPLASLTQLTALSAAGLQIDNDGLSVIRCAQGLPSLLNRGAADKDLDACQYCWMPRTSTRVAQLAFRGQPGKPPLPDSINQAHNARGLCAQGPGLAALCTPTPVMGPAQQFQYGCLGAVGPSSTWRT